MNKLHYHPKTQTFFNLETCQWCGGKACAPLSDWESHAKTKHNTWGEDKLPPYIDVSDEHECTVCDHCKGAVFYVERIKSEHAIIKRPNQEYVDGRKSRKAADQLCKDLNDSLRGTVDPLETTELTTSDGGAKLADTVVIRLGSTIDETYKRGVHLELPIETLMSLIKQLGVRPMAKNTERKTAKELIRSLIIKKKTDVQILEDVEKQFPESNADKKHCTKYRRELFVEEVVGVELAAVGSREHQEWAKANLAAAKRGPHKEYWTDYDNKLKAQEKEVKEKAAAAKKAAAEKAKAKKEATKKPAKKASANAGKKVPTADPADVGES